jgi:hypothetical protein
MGAEGAGRARRRVVPTASVRYEDGSVRELVFAELRLADFVRSVPWRQVRSFHGRAHYAGSYASVTTGGHVVYESATFWIGPIRAGSS